MVKNGTDWVLRNRDDVINTIFENKRDFLVEKHNDMKELYGDKQKNLVRKFETFDREIDFEDDKKSDIFNDIKLILYNGRKMPLKTRALETIHNRC